MQGPSHHTSRVQPPPSGRPGAIDTLVTALQDDPSVEVRVEAALALGPHALRRPSARGGLLAASASDDVELRGAAMEALGSLAETDDEAFARLVDGLNEADERSRAAAVRGLRRCGRSAPVLLRALEHDAVLMEAVSDALVEVGDRGVTGDLARMVGEAPSAAVRGAAARALGRLESREDHGVNQGPLNGYLSEDDRWFPLW